MNTLLKCISCGVTITLGIGPLLTNAAPNITNNGSNTYSIEQATSDNAQLHTLAFDALGFITGNTCSDSFLPPGKVADFFGFQYLRDVTQSGKGHSTDFVTNAANNVLSILSDAQKAKMLALAKAQSTSVSEYALERFPLMIAFRRQLENTFPHASTGLNKNSVMKYSGELYVLDGEITLARAKLFSEIINSFTTEQRAYLDTMVQGGFASWKALSDQLDKKLLTHSEDVLMMTYASEMFAWYAGDVIADTYFCPERQADYFGGFYLKDAPAMGNPGYTISESITGDAGASFINSLDASQKKTIVSIVDTQRSTLAGIVQKRKEISTLLRSLLAGSTIDAQRFFALEKQYGELDGEISYYYAMAFSDVNKTLTSAQRTKLEELRGLDAFVCPSEKAYLYSDRIDFPSGTETDFLFFAPSDITYSPISSSQFKVGSPVSGQKNTLLSEASKKYFISKLEAIPNDKKQVFYAKIATKIDDLIARTTDSVKLAKIQELKSLLQEVMKKYSR